MKKAIIWIFVLCLLCPVILAQKTLINTDTAWTIQKQDYFQEFIDYKIKYIDKDTYRLYWTKNSDFVFDVLKDCMVTDDDDCITTKATTNVRDYEKNTKSILGFGKKYTTNEFIESYFPSKFKKGVTKHASDLKLNSFPSYIIGEGSLTGTINPFLSDDGYIDIKFDVFNTETLTLNVGFGTLTIYFNNSKSIETLDFSRSGGFLIANNFTRYLSLSRYSNITDAKINITGVQGEWAIYEELDYFDDNYVWDAYWGTQEKQNGNVYNNNAFNSAAYGVIGSGAGTSYAGIFSNGTNEGNVNGNVSLLMYGLSFTCTAPGATTASSKLEIINGSGGGVTVYSVACGGGSSNSLNLVTLKFNFNNVTNELKVYNFSNDLEKTVSLGSMPNSPWYLKFLAATSGTSPAARWEIRAIGINKNAAIYNIWDESTVYPNGTTIKIGSKEIYNNVSTLSTMVELPITQNLTDALNSGACDCSGCVLNDYYCNIPFVFDTLDGAKLKYSNLIVNTTLAQLNVSVYDEETNQLITGLNVTLIFNSVSRSFNESTTSGSIIVGWTDFEDYTIRYYAEGYPLRMRIYTYDGSDDPKLSLYLANYSNSVSQRFVVFDQFRNRVANAKITITKFFVSSNSFVPILDLLTNVNGEASVSLVPETPLYRWLVYYNNVLVWNKSNPTGSPVYVDDGDYIINVNLGGDIYTIEQTLSLIDSTIIFNSDGRVGNFTLDFTSLNNISYCINMYNVTNLPEELINQVCGSGDSYSYLYSFNMSLPTTLLLWATVLIDGEYYVFDSKRGNIYIDEETKPFSKDYGYDGLFIAIIFLILAFLIFATYPVMAVFGVEISFLILLFTNIIDVSQNMKIVVATTSFIITVIVGKVVNHTATGQNG